MRHKYSLKCVVGTMRVTQELVWWRHPLFFTLYNAASRMHRSERLAYGEAEAEYMRRAKVEANEININRLYEVG